MSARHTVEANLSHNITCVQVQCFAVFCGIWQKMEIKLNLDLTLYLIPLDWYDNPLISLQVMIRMLFFLEQFIKVIWPQSFPVSDRLDAHLSFIFFVTIFLMNLYHSIPFAFITTWISISIHFWPRSFHFIHIISSNWRYAYILHTDSGVSISGFSKRSSINLSLPYSQPFSASRSWCLLLSRKEKQVSKSRTNPLDTFSFSALEDKIRSRWKEQQLH